MAISTCVSLSNINHKKDAFRSIVFDGSIVGGNENSVFYNKYLLPILNNNHLRDLVLTPKDNYHQKIFESLTNTWDTIFSEIPDYEMIVRNELSNLFRILIHLPENNLRCFKSIIGQSPVKYLKNYRLQSAAYMIRNTDYAIGAICE